MTNEPKHDVAGEDVLTSEDDDVWNMVVPHPHHPKADARSAAIEVEENAAAAMDDDAEKAEDRSAAAAVEADVAVENDAAAAKDAEENDAAAAAAAAADGEDAKKKTTTRCCRYEGDVLDNLAEPTLDAKNAADVRARIVSAADANAKTPAGLQIVRRVMDAYGRTAVDLVYQNASGVVLGAFKATAVDEKDVEVACLGCAERVNSSMDDIEAHVKDGPPTKHAVKFLKVRLADGATASLAEVVNGNNARPGQQQKPATAGAKRKSGASANAIANADADAKAKADDAAPASASAHAKDAGAILRKAVVKHAYVLRDARRAEDIPDLLDAVDVAEGAGRAERARRLLAEECADLGVDPAIFGKDREAVTANHVAEVAPTSDRDEDAMVREHDVAYTLPEAVVAARRACRAVAADVLVAVPVAAMRAAEAPVEVYDVAAAAVQAAAPLFRRHADWVEYARRVRDFANRAEEEEMVPPEPDDRLLQPQRFAEARAWIAEREDVARQIGRQAARAIALARDGCLPAALLQACAQCARDAAAAQAQVERDAALDDMKTINDGAQVAKRRKTA